MALAHGSHCFRPNLAPPPDGQQHQVGLAGVVLSRLNLVAVVSLPISDLAQRFALNVERSFSESACDVAYFEVGDDAFAVVKWDEAEHVEVYAYIEPPDDGNYLGQDEIIRFLRAAGIGWEAVVYPTPGHPAYSGP